jgi:hypothetical protein
MYLAFIDLSPKFADLTTQARPGKNEHTRAESSPRRTAEYDSIAKHLNYAGAE